MVRFLILFLPLFLFAHQSGLSYIKILEHSSKDIDINYKKPLKDLYATPIKINYPSYCMVVEKEPQEIINGFIVNRSKLDCGEKGLQSSRIWIDGLLRQDRGVIIEYTKKNFSKKALLRSDNPFIYFDKKESSFSLFTSYIKLGIGHILSGYDHLLFVLALLLLARSTKVLLSAITAFTLSHSITLASAILGIINLPVLFIESMIALSIIFLARELALPQIDSLTKRYLAIMAFIFGLLHGFGFSNVLRDIGLPKDDLYLALFSFNVGIELGQIFFIIVISMILFIVNKLFKIRKEKLKMFFAYFIGFTSTFWFIQRVMLF